MVFGMAGPMCIFLRQSARQFGASTSIGCKHDSVWNPGDPMDADDPNIDSHDADLVPAWIHKPRPACCHVWGSMLRLPNVV